MSLPPEHEPNGNGTGRSEDFLPPTEVVSPADLEATAAGDPALEAAGDIRPAGYEILGELGRGGVGVVFQARQRPLGRMVALKMLLLGRRASPTALMRFRQEAATIAGLKHANIIQIYEVGEWNGVPYLTLEFCEGGNLLQRHAQQPLRPREAAGLIEKLACAMQAAHAAGVIHRDLKPANILFLADGTPKITDFGLAKRLEDSSPTGSTEVVGTPSYMAPEQTGWARHAIGPATDVYALGAILYQMLTGRPPFQAPTSLETVAQVVENEPVRPVQLQPRTPLDLETICLKCLEKVPDRRYPSAAALADDLRRFLAGEPIVARPVRWAERVVKWVQRRPVISGLLAAVVLVLVAGISGIAVAWQRAVESEAEANRQARKAWAAVFQADQARHSAEHARTEAEAAIAAKLKAQQRTLWQEQRLRDEQDRAKRAETQAQLFNRVQANSFLLLAKDSLREEHNAKNLPKHALDDAGDLLQNVAGKLRFWDWRYLMRQYRGGIVTLEQEETQILAVAWSPDKQWLAAASRGGSVHVWDVASRQVVSKFRPKGGDVYGVAFDPASKKLAACDPGGRRSRRRRRPRRPLSGRLAVCDAAGAVYILEAGAQEPRPMQRHHRGVAYSVAFQPDGQELASGGADGMVRIWQAASGVELATIRVIPNGAVLSVAYSPKGDLLAAATAGGQVYLFAAGSRRECFHFQAHKGKASSVAFASTGNYLATGGSDRLVKIWRSDRKELIRTCQGHEREVLTVAFCPGHHLLASASLDRTLRVWDSRSGKILATHQRHLNVVNSLAWSPRGAWLASGSLDGTIKIWDPLLEDVSRELPGHDGDVLALAFSPRGRRLASASADGKILLHKLSGGTPLQLPGQYAKRVILAFDPSGKALAVAANNFAPLDTAATTTGDSVIRLWDTTTGQLQATLKGHKGDVLCLVWTAEGRQLLSAGRDRQLIRWDAATGQLVKVVTLAPVDVTALAFSCDGQYLAVGQRNGSVRLWDVAREKPRPFALQTPSPVTHLLFSPDGQHLVAGNQEKVQLWDVIEKKPTYIFPRRQSLQAIAFTADSQRLVTGYGDSKVFFWDVLTGQPLLRLTAGPDQIWSLAVSPDQHFVVAGNGSGTIKLWDGRPLPEN